MSLNFNAVFRYKVGVIRNGKRLLSTEWKNNLILDSGLDMVASTVWANCFKVAIFGDQVSPTPVSRNGGAITFSQATTAITASGNFFAPADTGRLFKFDSGEEAYLTYVSATVATASVSRTVSSGPGTVWYVNQTAVESVFSYSNAYGSTGGDNGTSSIGNVVTMKRTLIGPAAGAPATLTEIGFNSGAGNSNIFDRDIITGGVSILAGDFPLAIAELILTIPQSTPQAVGNVATGYDSSGDVQVCSLGIGGNPNIAFVESNGSTNGTTAANLEPSYSGSGAGFFAILSTYTIPTFNAGTGTPISATFAQCATCVPDSYNPGTFYRDLISAFGIADAVGTVYGYALNPSGFTQKFTTPFAKSSAQVMSFTLRRSWQRILVN